jgi:hypothetical protein
MGTQYAQVPLEPFAWCKNGQTPDSELAVRIADHTNQAALYRLKELASFGSTPLIAPVNSGATVRWRFPFMPSPYADAIIVRAWMAPATTSSATSPGIKVRIESGLEVGGTPATIGDGVIRYAGSPTGIAPADVPTNFPNLWTLVQTSELSNVFPTIPANTWLFGTVSEIDRGRCNSIAVYEAFRADVTAPPCQEGAALGTPIYDKDRQDAITAARLLWKRGAGRFFSWSVNRDADVRTRTSATPINVVDNSSTTASSTTLGFYPNAIRRSTIRRGTVPCKFWVYGSAAAGAGGIVQLRDSSNAVLATISGITTAAWYDTLVNLPATDAKYDVFYRGDGTNVFNFYACALTQYESGT